MKKIHTEKAPAAIGPYSQGIQTGNLVFVSGQLPVNPETNEMPDNISDQATQSCQNVEAILTAAGTNMASVCKTTCFLADMKYFADFNAVYEKYFVSKPARSCFAVKELPKGALCEIEVIAELEQ